MPSAVKFEVLIIVGNSEKPKECSEQENSLKKTRSQHRIKFVKFTARVQKESLQKLKAFSIGGNFVNPQRLLIQGEIVRT